MPVEAPTFEVSARRAAAVYFLHIPKTAGTSLRAWLESHFPRHEVCPQLDPATLLASPREVLARYKVICGHYGMYLPGLLDPPPLMITLLRDPLSRSVSHYRDIRSRPNHPLYDVVRTQSFEQFVSSELGESELLNLQCRFLALDDAEADLAGHDRLQRSDMPALRAKYSDPAMLERAERALAGMAAIGICERVDAAACAIARVLGLPPPPPIERLNVGVAPLHERELTPRALRRVRELTVLDQRLYNLVAASAGAAHPAPTRAAPPSHIPS